MLARIREAVRKAGAQAPRDEVFPSDGAPVLVLREGKVVPAVMGWGFPGMQAGQNVINARAETAEERPMFRDGVAARRCVVPATGFYEWDADKRRYLFRMPARTELYMAALYGVFGGEARYCILTTQANASVAPVHHRMPLVLRAQEVRPSGWRMNKPRAACCTKRRRSWSGGRRTASCGCGKKTRPGNHPGRVLYAGSRRAGAAFIWSLSRSFEPCRRNPWG